MKRLITIILILWALIGNISAQLSGYVIDRYTGDSIAYASIAYKGYKIGVSADLHGKYTIARHNGRKLTFSAIGYQSQEIDITPKVGNTLIVKLKPDTRKLGEVIVKSKRKNKYSRKNNPAVELMRKVIEKKKLTDLKQNPYYQFTQYQKITLALNDLTPEKLESKTFKSKQWMIDQVEVCKYNNKLILPVSVEENVKQHIYRKDPLSEKTILKGNNTSGVNEILQTGDIINVVLKDVFTDVNIYDDDVRLFQYPFTSPIGKGAISFYRYYITDTTFVENDKCIQLEFTPNNQQDFGFRGTIYILADSSYQVRRCELTIPKKSDVNFVENMKCLQEFTKLPNGEWALTQDDMFVELKLAKFLQKFVVIRTTRNSDYSFDPLPKNIYKGKKKELRDSYASMQSDDFWKQYRQVELTKSESSMDQFVKHLQEIKGLKYLIFGVKAFIENFVETGTQKHPSKVDIGPVNTMISSNFYDGLRLRASAQTTANLNKHWFLKGYYAHGFNTNNNYYDAEVIYSFNEKGYLPREFPKQTLSFIASHDVAMPSDKFIQTDKDNVFISFKMHDIDKMFMYTKQDLDFVFEQEWGLKLFANLKAEKMEPVGDVMKFQKLDGSFIDHTRSTEFTCGFRYAPGETFINTKLRRLPINLDTPILRLQHTFGINKFLGGEYNYNISELEIYKRTWMPHNWGKIDCRIRGGVQWNKVPFTYLITPVANLSYIIEDEMFDMINNMEFMNDRYASLELSWDFNGKLFNRIPLLKKLKWREFIELRALWGTLSDKNNPAYYQSAGILDNTVLQFPYGCYKMDGKRPYYEMSFGIHNIFKILHVEYIHRFNYNELPTASKDCVKFMFRASF